MDLNLNKKQGIYIQLDALLDTRLSTLYSLGEDLVFDCLSSNYFTRRTDTFEGIEKEVFDLAYSKRDKVTLSNAVVTKAIGFIKELVLRMTSQAIKTPFHSGARIIINTYPYDLEEVEVSAIISGLAQAISGTCDIEAINKSFEELTPKYCKDNLSYMFFYEYSSWLDIQANNFKELPCPEIMVIVPGIYFVREPTKQELSEAIKDFMHPLRAIEYLSAYFIDLKLYDIDLFCANIQVEKPEDKKT